MISDYGIVMDSIMSFLFLMCRRRRIFSPQLNRHICYYTCILLCICMVTASNAAIVSVSGVMQNRNNAVEGSGMPIGGEFGSSKYLDEWKASGLNPDDEPGDVDEEGSGNDPEMVDGSGHPPSSNKHRNDGSTTTNDESIRVNEALLNANIRQLQPSSTEASPSTTSRVIIHRPEIEVPSLAAPGPTRPPIQFHVVSSSPASFISTKLSTTTSSFAVATVKPTVRPPIPPQLPPYVTEDESYELLKPGILAAISGGGVVGVLVVILVVMFIVYRLRKKDEGSYSLDEPHQPPNYSYAYQKAATKEFYA